jgi:HK97 gp10 family phage protein
MSAGQIDNFIVDLETTLRKFKVEFGVELIARTKARTPVKTGALQNGFGFEVKKTSIAVYNTKDYAGYVEFGTPYMAPRAMLRTSLEESDEIADIAMQKAKGK